MTTIEWTDRTWNPTVGCSKASPGCDNCYAIGVAHRAMQPAHAGLTVRSERGTDWTGEVRCIPDRLNEPLRWRKPSMVFVNSMSDLFHPDIPLDFLGDVWLAMHNAHTKRGHTFQVLTKRPQRMARALGPDGIDWYAVEGPVPNPEPGIWLGTSIESDRYAFRADHLRNTPAAVRFLSLEPLLGPLPSLNLDGIGWVIVGGESGPGARPMHPDWVRDIRDRCVDAGVPFFFKQWGAWGPDQAEAILASGGDTTGLRPMGKKATGRLLDGRTWDEMPGVPA